MIEPFRDVSAEVAESMLNKNLKILVFSPLVLLLFGCGTAHSERSNIVKANAINPAPQPTETVNPTLREENAEKFYFRDGF